MIFAATAHKIEIINCKCDIKKKIVVILFNLLFVNYRFIVCVCVLFFFICCSWQVACFVEIFILKIVQILQTENVNICMGGGHQPKTA